MLTDAIASTILAPGRADIIGDTYATPDELAWLDVGYTAFKLIGFVFAPWLLTRVDPRRLLLLATLVMGAACAAAVATAVLDVLVVLRAVQGLAGRPLRVRGHRILSWNFPPSTQPHPPAVFA